MTPDQPHDDPLRRPAHDRPPAPNGRPSSGVRTFTPRWRSSPLTDERMAALMPRYGVESQRLDEAARARIYGRVAPFVLEIGSGHGAAARAYAAAHPEHDVLAVEVHVPGIARMLAAADEEGLTTLRVHRGDALDLLHYAVPDGSLQAVHLFFPDPWPKARHAKRRFVQQHTLDLFARRLRPGGHVLVATDHELYAQHVREQLAEHGGYEVVEGERPSWRPTDGFEDKGTRAGRVIHELRLTPRGRG
ncbi:tRNA (guanosine(46)-N7)-methyltransferase TrmB [Janibacter melonis]|uniref:tRNA (guanine-N(7)-)-methyltransferase n=1 Tax=Janibacter melonis TaxID=262209 RepID=A0A5P8FL97_9MICO|nr:tRNA (guanosine(46)-N7)-methyltransferase TrmB [Janibacter melonis]QFQ29830.1 tRNA (guanosine(46)-N7)-methyltransferase TrmB [Janibacter melonis]